MSTVRSIAKSFKFFAKRPNRGLYVFNVTECEICAKELCDANSVTIYGATARDLQRAGMTERDVPLDEGGYSEIHDLSTCSDCCYDENAKAA